jgi:hypothetical protein
MDGRVTPHGCRGVNSPHPPIDLSSNTSAQFNKSYGRAHATTVGTAMASGNQATFRDAGGGTTATGNLAAFLQALEKRLRDLRLVGGQDILFGRIKMFIQDRLFESQSRS